MRTGRALRGVPPVKLLASLAAVTLVGVAAVAGTQAVLSDTTESPGSEFDAGQIDLADNGAGRFLYQVHNVLPGDPRTEACIRVSYTGTPDLTSTVELYMDTPIGLVGPYVDLDIHVGTQPGAEFPGCTGFQETALLYRGTLSSFQAAHGAAGAGVEYSPNGTAPWEPGNTVVYRVTLTLKDADRPPGANSSGPHTYTWRARTV